MNRTWAVWLLFAGDILLSIAAGQHLVLHIDLPHLAVILALSGAVALLGNLTGLLSHRRASGDGLASLHLDQVGDLLDDL